MHPSHCARFKSAIYFGIITRHSYNWLFPRNLALEYPTLFSKLGSTSNPQFVPFLFSHYKIGPSPRKIKNSTSADSVFVWS